MHFFLLIDWYGRRTGRRLFGHGFKRMLKWCWGCLCWVLGIYSQQLRGHESIKYLRQRSWRFWHIAFYWSVDACCWPLRYREKCRVYDDNAEEMCCIQEQFTQHPINDNMLKFVWQSCFVCGMKTSKRLWRWSGGHKKRHRGNDSTMAFFLRELSVNIDEWYVTGSLCVWYNVTII